MTERADHIVEQGAHAAAEEQLEGVPENILLPYQQEWVSDEGDVKIIEKSRRIGISWAEAADAALYAAQGSGANVYYMAFNQDMTKQFIKDTAWWAKWYDLAASAIREKVIEDEDKDIKVFEIEFDSGNIVQALSSSPRNLRSKGAPGERVIFDEFAFHDHQEELIKAGMAFLMWGGKVRIISTHNGVANPFNRLLEDVRAGKKPYSDHRVTLDDAIEQGLYERICLMQEKEYSEEGEAKWREDLIDFYGDGADEELFCIPSESTGRYFKRVVVESCQDKAIPTLQLELDDEFVLKPEKVRRSTVQEWCEQHLLPHLRHANPDLKSYFGHDFARTGDLSVLIPGQQDTDLTRRVLFALEMRNVPFEAQKQVLFFVADRLPRFTAGNMDATGNGAFLAEVAKQRYGQRIEEVKMSNAWHIEAWPKYKSGLEDGLVALPGHVDILDDHSDVVRQGGIPKVPAGKTRKGADGKQRHGDAAVAGCLMWQASLRQVSPIEYTADEGSARAGNAAYAGMAGDESFIDESAGFGAVRGGMNFGGYQ